MRRENDLNIGLVLLAAGFGTRFGGNKQLSIIGPENAIIMDYTIYDAWRIGYSWITVILRDEIVDQFEREVGQHWRNKIELRYSLQQSDAYIPSDLFAASYVAQRVKPWGTAHALLCAAKQVDGPFAVANADDFYGYHGLKEIFFYLRQAAMSPDLRPRSSSPLPLAMVGFQLGRTLSENGAVSRGICHSYRDARGRNWLDNIQEHTQLIRDASHGIRSIQSESENDIILAENTPVSMNLFGLQPEIFPYLERQFKGFLRGLRHMVQLQNLQQALKKEFYLPAAVETMLERQQASVAMLHSPDPWFGLTYIEDLPAVRAKIQKLIHSGNYPADLFAQEMTAF